MAAPTQEALLEEYRGAYDKIGRIDALVWQTAALMFPLILAAMAYFGIRTEHNTSQLSVLVLVAVGSVALVVTWYLLSAQWHGYQKLAFYRMREIESTLGIWHYRYAGFVSLDAGQRAKKITEIKSDEEREALARIGEAVPAFPRLGLIGAIRVMTWGVILGWAVLIVREFTLTPR